MATDRARAIDAADVLNDFIGDFITGVMVFHDYSNQLQQGKLQMVQMVPIQKMCLSNVVLGFAKFEEFWRHYHDIVPEEHRAACKAILKEIRTRKIGDFRNHCVGHIWDNEKKRPLMLSEVMSALEVLAAPNFKAFLDWVNNPRANVYPTTVVSVIEAVRDSISAQHKIHPDEIFKR